MYCISSSTGTSDSGLTIVPAGFGYVGMARQTWRCALTIKESPQVRPARQAQHFGVYDSIRSAPGEDRGDVRGRFDLQFQHGLLRVKGDVRRGDDVGQRQQWMIGRQTFRHTNVECGPGDPAFVQRLQQRILVDYRAARRVDDKRGWLHA